MFREKKERDNLYLKPFMTTGKMSKTTSKVYTFVCFSYLNICIPVTFQGDVLGQTNSGMAALTPSPLKASQDLLIHYQQL